MKSLVYTLLVAAVAIPVVSFGQANGQLTRAQVRAELIEWEEAGYHPAGGEDPCYPQAILATKARLAAKKTAAAEK
jgi:Domain of unknown function (DUF4148)